MTLPTRADVVVVGAGMAGLAAAVTASEQGAQVLLVEKAAEPGGSFAISGGYVWTLPSMEAYRATVPLGDVQLGAMVLEDFDTGIEWLQEHGSRLGPRIDGVFVDTEGRGHRFEPDPVSAGVAPLRRAFAAAQGRLSCRTKLASLVQDDGGAIVGVRVRSASRQATIAAGAVILATGGFACDLERTTLLISPYADRFVVRTAPTATGDGIRLAFDAGAAASRGLHAFYGHLMPAPPAEIEPGSFRRLTQFYSPHTVMLNLRGERFADEARGDAHLALALAGQLDAAGFLVFDSESHTRHVSRAYLHDAVDVDPLVAVREVGGAVLEASSPDDLAQQLATMGMPPAVARRTLHDYDEAIAAGRAGDLAVPRSGHLHRLATPPFYAVPVVPGITSTEGGVRVDRECRMIDRDGEPIRGLYAAGVDVGGFSYDGYAGALAAALTTGLRAGVHATIDAPTSSSFAASERW